jgi:uncharacterized membrane protein YhaH (DUF805 family)
MDTFTQLLPFAIWSVLSLIPALSICKRVGKTRWWSVIALLPFIGPIVFMFIIAYSQWYVKPSHNVMLTASDEWRRAR